uniref:Cytochrome c oxidase assembly factor 4 homolog n=1 Tax=Hucho hucho TaxID=62062 RepID=A0A4W5QRI4_9TELE
MTPCCPQSNWPCCSSFNCSACGYGTLTCPRPAVFNSLETAGANRSRRPSSSEDQDEEDLVDQMINRTGSMEQHYAVQEGRADHQDWRKCQREVQTFKNCMMTFQGVWKKQLMRQATAAVVWDTEST